mgnify:CR=1 FL=1
MHACGREDIDVRCYGNGRPFVIKLLNPDVDIALLHNDDQDILDDLNMITTTANNTIANNIHGKVNINVDSNHRMPLLLIILLIITINCILK